MVAHFRFCILWVLMSELQISSTVEDYMFIYAL
jgi:hypothetical protein